MTEPQSDSTAPARHQRTLLDYGHAASATYGVAFENDRLVHIVNKHSATCRDSARRRSLRRSRSFNVTDFGINRKPVYDFLLVNNTNSHPISRRFQVTADQ